MFLFSKIYSVSHFGNVLNHRWSWQQHLSHSLDCLVKRRGKKKKGKDDDDMIAHLLKDDTGEQIEDAVLPHNLFLDLVVQWKFPIFIKETGCKFSHGLIDAVTVTYQAESSMNLRMK